MSENEGRAMRRMSMVTVVGLIVFVVGSAGAAWAWERHGNATELDGNRRAAIERAGAQQSFESAAIYGAAYPQSDPDAWRAATLVMGSAAMMGALSAVAGFRPAKGG